jgi:hypothetical protein
MKFNINNKIVCMFLVAIVMAISGALIYLAISVELNRPFRADQNPAKPGISEAQAQAIAEATCIKGGGALKSGGTYNLSSNTWWFDANLNATRPGCNPACVVSAETKKAEINWRCTGAVPSPGQQEGTTLDLSNKGLNKLPMDIFNQTDLIGLNVSGNKLTGSLPSQLGNLKKLKFLDASNNQYTGIPAEIGQLSDLETANFSYNAITGLPLEIGNLKKLKTIDFTSNDYSTYDLSKIKQALPNLQVIGEKKY